MTPGNRAHWLQVLVFIIIVTAPICNAATPNERRWEKADLIVEGVITETTALNGNIVSSVSVDRVLKTGFLELNQLYLKGYVDDLTFQVQASNIPVGEPKRLFLEETDAGYRVIASESIEEQNPELLDPGLSGLIILILITVIASRPVHGKK